MEIGAGGGYWARLLRDVGVDILAFDTCPPELNDWAGGAAPWTSILKGGEEVLIDHAERAVFVSWPPRPNGFMPALLDRAPQRTLALITDGPSLVGEDPMYVRLQRNWIQSCQIELPTSPYRHDHLIIWERA